MIYKKKMNRTDLVSKYCNLPADDEVFSRFYKKQISLKWTAEELDYTSDVSCFRNSLTESEKEIVRKIVAFFLVGDGVVIDNLSLNFLPSSKSRSMEAYFIAQMYQELIHVETYNQIAMSICETTDELNKLLLRTESEISVKLKKDFGEKWMNSSDPIKKYIAFTFMEGVQFFTLFLIISSFRSRGLLKNLDHANSLIRKDETLHRDVGIELIKRSIFSLCEQKGMSINLATNTVKGYLDEISEEVFQIEKECCVSIFPKNENIDGISLEGVMDYAKICINNIYTGLGFSPKYLDAKIHYNWLIEMDLTMKPNIQEIRSAPYSESLKDLLNPVKNEDVYENLDNIDF